MARSSRHRVDLDDTDFAMLEMLEERMGLNRSEIVRRLVRTACGAGPFLTAENSKEIAVLSQQMRRAGGNLYALLDALRQGFAVSDQEAEAVWQELHGRVMAIEAALSELTASHGLKLRRSLNVAEAAV
jgi:two-component sensor histidine kinase